MWQLTFPKRCCRLQFPLARASNSTLVSSQCVSARDSYFRAYESTASSCSSRVWHAKAPLWLGFCFGRTVPTKDLFQYSLLLPPGGLSTSVGVSREVFAATALQPSLHNLPSPFLSEVLAAPSGNLSRCPREPPWPVKGCIQLQTQEPTVSAVREKLLFFGSSSCFEWCFVALLVP